MSTDPNAEDLLGTAVAARQHTRRARQGYWFPLVAFGALVAGASPFYVENVHAVSEAGGTLPPGVSGPLPTSLLQGGGPMPLGGDARGAGIYWLIALPVGYAAVLLFYRLRARRAGVAGRVWPFLAAGLGLLALLLVTSRPVDRSLNLQAPGDLTVRGLLPIVIIALGLFVLAWSERSAVLTAFAVCYFALALLANLYDLENLVPASWLGGDYSYSAEPNLLLPAAVLLLGGAFFAVRARRTR